MTSSKMTALVSVMDLPFLSGPILLEFLPGNGVRGLYFQGGCIFKGFVSSVGSTWGYGGIFSEL